MNNIVDIRSERNFEIAMRLHSDINNEAGEFYTDLNGFQMIKRQYFAKLPLQVKDLKVRSTLDWVQNV